MVYSMSEPIKFRYKTLGGTQRKVEFEQIPGSTHWNRTVYEKHKHSWQVVGSTEVKYVREVD